MADSADACRDDQAPAPPPARLPFRAWHVPVFGALLGLASGTLAYFLQVSIEPGITSEPIGQYVWVVLYNVLAWSTWLAFVPLIWWLSTQIRIVRREALLPTAFHVGASLLVAGVHCLIGGTVQYWMLVVSGQPDSAVAPLTWASRISRVFLYSFEWEVLLYWGIIGLSHALQFHRELQWRELRESRLETRLAAARLESLQRQLHPHFVFNTLNAIATLVHRDADAAEAMIVRLGELLRAVFRSDVQQEIPLARELALTEQYLDIQRLRFGANLRFDVDLPAGARRALVPVLLLQPLVENAIKHGFAGAPAGGSIRLRGRSLDGDLELTVSDDGRGVTPGQLQQLIEGVGLSNTRARLEHLYPGSHAVTVRTPEEGGFAVSLRFPWRVSDRPGEIAEIIEIPA